MGGVKHGVLKFSFPKGGEIGGGEVPKLYKPLRCGKSVFYRTQVCGHIGRFGEHTFQKPG